MGPRLGATLLAALLLAGCAGGAPSLPGMRHSFEQTLELGPASAREVNFEMQEGAHVLVSFDATRAVTWDVHSHEGERVDTWHNGTNASLALDFVAPAANTYSLYVRTSLAPANVTVRLDGEYTGGG